MTLREALKTKTWEALKNLQNEEWNRTDLLNEDFEWLDSECQAVGESYIIDESGDELTELINPAAALGKKGGQAKSEKKAVSSRENGKKGGRPRKITS